MAFLINEKTGCQIINWYHQNKFLANGKLDKLSAGMASNIRPQAFIKHFKWFNFSFKPYYNTLKNSIKFFKRCSPASARKTKNYAINFDIWKVITYVNI